MGIFDKAKDLISKNRNKVGSGVDKATDVADDRTGNTHTENLEKVDDAARKYGDDKR